MKRKHLIISSIIFIFSIISLILVFDHLLGIRHSNIKSILEIESSRSAGAIVDRFNQTYAIIDNMNYQIKTSPSDKKNINNILNKYKTNPSLVDTFSWTIFSWVNISNQITVDATYGIMKNPVDLSNRDYIALTTKNPNVFYLGKPVMGSTSKKWMIPGGVGLNDKNGNYAGSMTIGFEIDALARIIQKSLQNKNVKVSLIYDYGDLPVLYANSKEYNSFRDQQAVGDKNINKILAHLKSSNNNQIDDIALVKDQHGYLARKLENYPFVLVLEYDKVAIINELWSSIISRISEILLIIFAAAALLYLIYKREREQTKIERVLKNQLYQANKKLRILNKSINHDLRNYISGILGVANIIAEDKDLRKEDAGTIIVQDQKHAAMIISQAKIMLKFSNALMTDEGIERKLKLQMANRKLGEETEEDDFEDIDIDALINQLILLKRPFTKEQEVSVKIDITESLPILRTNLIEIRKILDNLITNAIKYSPKGSEVRIVARCLDAKNQNWIATAEPRNDGVGSLASKPETPSFCHGQSPRNDRGANGDAAIQPFASSQPLIINSSTSPSIDSSPEKYLQIEIIDNGIGMSPEDIEKALSGEGKSIDKSGIDKPIDSHGIGFPIVKQAVENLDAVMEIKSEKGKGTKIAVRFKIGKKQIAADCGGELHSPLQPTQSQSTSTPSSSSSINSSLNGKTILIADDEALILMATERQLMRLGCNVLTAKSGDEAITILDNNHCDVVLMDCNMTKVNDGLATAKLIREGSIFKNFKNYKTIPIIAFSANTDQKSQDAALKSGMNGYLEKPFDKEMFAKIVNGFQD